MHKISSFSGKQASRLMRHSLTELSMTNANVAPIKRLMLLQLIDIVNIWHMTGRLFGDATDSVVHWVDVRSAWSNDMNCDVTCSRTVSRVYESAVLN